MRCVGCVFDGEDHSCGYVETPADFEIWREKQHMLGLQEAERRTKEILEDETWGLV